MAGRGQAGLVGGHGGDVNRPDWVLSCRFSRTGCIHEAGAVAWQQWVALVPGPAAPEDAAEAPRQWLGLGLLALRPKLHRLRRLLFLGGW